MGLRFYVGDTELSVAPQNENFTSGPCSFEQNIACGINPSNVEYADVQITDAINRRTTGDFVHDASNPFPGRVVGRLGIVAATHGGSLASTLPYYLQGAVTIFEPTGFVTGTQTYVTGSSTCDMNSNLPNNGQYRIHFACSDSPNELCFNNSKQNFYFDNHLMIGGTHSSSAINLAFPKAKNFRIGGLVRGAFDNLGSQIPTEGLRYYVTVSVYARDLHGDHLPDLERLP